MKVLFLDCFSGISGDMMVGALCDLGVKPSVLEWELSKLDLEEFHMHFDRQQRQNIEGVKFGVFEGAHHEGEGHGEECCHGHEHHHEHSHSHGEECCHSHGDCHGHHHEHDHHGHHHHEHGAHAGHEHKHGRNHAQIRALIEQSDLTPFVKKHALSIFQRIAIAEGKVHGVPPEEVGFHEVGALDSIVDIICTCVGLEQLGIEKVCISPLQEGHGWVDCAHGRFPVPATATLEILAGIPISQTDETHELITPTGAAIVAEFGSGFGLMPRMRINKIGYGLGTRHLKTRPNVLRAVLGEMESAYQTDTVTSLETNLDDLSPEIAGAVLGKLLAAGALDAYLTPVQMKKNRPAFKLTVLSEEKDLASLADLIFAETTAFGLRMHQMGRLKLERRFEEIQTPFGKVTVKLGLKDGKVLRVSPEFESCRALSESSGQPLVTIYEAAIAAAQTKFA